MVVYFYSRDFCFAKTSIQEKIIKYPDRAEAERFFNYPYPAVEEALANAVYHKGYNVREPIEVRVESDRIQIVSYPGPERSVTMEDLKSFNVVGRRYRNRRVGDYLKELHLTEGRNTGFRKIIRALESNGSPLPEFVTDEGHSYFVTIIHIHEKFNAEMGNHAVIGKQPENLDNSWKTARKPGISAKQPEKQPENLDDSWKTARKPEISAKQPEKRPENKSVGDNTVKSSRMGSRINDVIGMIRIQPSISRKVLSEKLGLTQSEVRTVLTNLKRDGKIFHEGPDKGGRWVINENE